jgi:hypothetical protein
MAKSEADLKCRFASNSMPQGYGQDGIGHAALREGLEPDLFCRPRVLIFSGLGAN